MQIRRIDLDDDDDEEEQRNQSETSGLGPEANKF